MRILVVDDELSNRNLLIHMMRPYGTCTGAVDGAEAVSLFKQALLEGRSFDLVLLDIMMPEMDGQQALKKIRIAERTMYGPSLDMKCYACIIMVTCLDDPVHLIEAYTKGKCNGYLNKPIVQEDLIEKLVKNNLIR